MTNKPIIAMYGDSTTYGVTYDPAAVTWDQNPNSEPATLQRLFPNAVVENHGHSSATAFQQLLGIGYAAGNNWWHEMATSDAYAVTINFAINDTGYRVSDYQAILGALIDIAHVAGKVVIVETPNPVAAWADDKLSRYADAARTTAAAHGALVADKFCDIQAHMPDWPDHLPDLIHPGTAMYGEAAASAAVALAPVLGIVPDGYIALPVGNFGAAWQSNILIADPKSGNVARLEIDNGFTFKEIGWKPPEWTVTGTSMIDASGTSKVFLHDPASGTDSALVIDAHGYTTWQPIGGDWSP